MLWLDWIDIGMLNIGFMEFINRLLGTGVVMGLSYSTIEELTIFLETRKVLVPLFLANVLARG
jgi:hypothetical protein